MKAGESRNFHRTLTEPASRSGFIKQFYFLAHMTGTDWLVRAS